MSIYDEIRELVTGATGDIGEKARKCFTEILTMDMEDAEDIDGRSVCHTELPNGYRVSTVRLVRRMHAFDMPDKYETAVFYNDEGCFMPIDTKEYSTVEDARLGHVELVDKWSRMNEAEKE